MEQLVWSSRHKELQRGVTLIELKHFRHMRDAWRYGVRPLENDPDNCLSYTDCDTVGNISLFKASAYFLSYGLLIWGVATRTKFFWLQQYVLLKIDQVGQRM